MAKQEKTIESRITQMEQRLNRAEAAMRMMDQALEQYLSAQGDLEILNAYLGSPDWIADREADEAGRLSSDLKRGVLSEDSIWNLLEDNRELQERMSGCVQQTGQKEAFRPMRRFKQQMTDQECVDLLRSAPRGVLGVIGDGGYPYTVPLDFLYDGGCLYFHCAKEGHKLDAIRSCDKVSFCVLSEGKKEPGDWWYHFDSVICFGRIRVVEDPVESDNLLRKLGAKYFPQGYDLEDDMRKNAPRALVLQLRVEHMSGKHVREK